jgi:hypothetical protein
MQPSDTPTTPPQAATSKEDKERIRIVGETINPLIMLSGLTHEQQIELCTRLLAGAIQRTIVFGNVNKRPLSRQQRDRIIEYYITYARRALRKKFLTGIDGEPLP